MRGRLFFPLAFFAWFAAAVFTVAAAASADQKSADQQQAESQISDQEYFELYKALADTIDQVERNYVKPIDRRELMEAAIAGIITKLDPYSNYISPEEFTGFRTSVENQFGGIGIQVTVDGGHLKVASPLVGSPAYRAGVQAGDRIIKIEGEPTEKFSLDDAVKKLKGPVGTEVTFTVRHELTGKTEDFTLKREVIQLDTVMGHHRKGDDSWDYMLDPKLGIGYIRVNGFGQRTAGQIRSALKTLQAEGMRALVLDLRFNPGGLLTSAVEVCDLFIEEGRIVSTEGRNTPKRVWEAVKPGTYADFPMVVLVNRYSASASEIVAACLQDHDRAAVVGERTWGKGSVQNVIELESGKSALKLTTASYKRPNGHNIHRFPDAKESDEWGVKPDKGMEIKLGSREMISLLNDRALRERVSPRQASANEGSVNDDDANEEKNANQSESDGEAGSDDDSSVPNGENNSAGGESTSDAPAENKPAPGESSDGDAEKMSRKSEPPPMANEPAKSEDAPAKGDASDGEKREPEQDSDSDVPKRDEPKRDKPAKSQAGSANAAQQPKPYVDRQLAKAVKYLKSQLSTDPQPLDSSSTASSSSTAP